MANCTNVFSFTPLSRGRTSGEKMYNGGNLFMHPERTSLMTLAGIEMHVVRKNIRHVYLLITPPGNIHIAAPFRCPDESILRFVHSKISWIEKTRQKVRHDMNI